MLRSQRHDICHSGVKGERSGAGKTVWRDPSAQSGSSRNCVAMTRFVDMFRRVAKREGGVAAVERMQVTTTPQATRRLAAAIDDRKRAQSQADPLLVQLIESSTPPPPALAAQINATIEPCAGVVSVKMLVICALLRRATVFCALLRRATV
jgi:hypothetical protein